MSGWTIQTLDPSEAANEAANLGHDIDDVINLPDGTVLRFGNRDGVSAVHVERNDLFLIGQADSGACLFGGNVDETDE